MIHRQFGTPFDVNSGELNPNKRGRASIDEFEECTIEEEECGGYGEIDQSGHLDFNPEKRIRNSSYTNNGVPVEDRHNDNNVHAEKRSRTTSFRQPNFSSHAGFSFNDSSTTIMRLEGELRTER